MGTLATCRWSLDLLPRESKHTKNFTFDKIQESDRINATTVRERERPNYTVHTHKCKIHTVHTVHSVHTVHTVHTEHTVHTVHTAHTVYTVHTEHTVHTVHAVHTGTFGQLTIGSICVFFQPLFTPKKT